MAKGYRSWEERRQIARSIIADSGTRPLADFQLSESEEVYFRARTTKAVDRLARASSTFKEYYSLPTEKPFGYVIGLTAIVVAFGVASALFLVIRGRGHADLYPLLAATGTLTVAAIGWAVAGWIAHRNAVRQNTTNLLFARFSQTAFTDAMHRFHARFGYDPARIVTPELMAEAHKEGPDGQRAAEGATYMLNYFEFIASGVLHGDLDQRIVRENLRGFVIYYHDKCYPVVRTANRRNPRAYEFLIKLRTHYREP